MTDNEIIKALDEAELFLRNRVMDGQPLKLNEYDISILRNISQTCAKAYDDINRLKAYNKELTAKLEKWLDRYNEQCIKIVKLKHDVQAAKSEAYKEFAEACKACFPSLSKVFDIILKEMGSSSES